MQYIITDLLFFFDYCLISTQSCDVFIDSLSMTTEIIFFKCLLKIHVQLHKNKPLQDNTIPAFFLDIYKRKKSFLNCVKLIICYTFCWKLVIFELAVTPTLYLGKIHLQSEKQWNVEGSTMKTSLLLPTVHFAKFSPFSSI